jgi:hypothetical protein
MLTATLTALLEPAGAAARFQGEARLQDGILATSGFPSVMFSALLKTFSLAAQGAGQAQGLCAAGTLK